MSSGNKYTIDRFEGDLAVLLLRSGENVQKDVPRSELPDKAKQGDILDVSFHEDGAVKYAAVLENETDEARKKAQEMLKRIMNKHDR